MMPLFPFDMRIIYLKEAAWYIIQMNGGRIYQFLLDFANESPSSLGGDVLLFSHIYLRYIHILGCIGMLWSLKEHRVCWFPFMLVSVYHISVLQM